MRNCLKIIVLTALCGALCITALSCRDGETKERDGQAAVSSTVTAALEISAPVSAQTAATETISPPETAVSTTVSEANETVSDVTDTTRDSKTLLCEQDVAYIQKYGNPDPTINGNEVIYELTNNKIHFSFRESFSFSPYAHMHVSCFYTNHIVLNPMIYRFPSVEWKNENGEWIRLSYLPSDIDTIENRWIPLVDVDGSITDIYDILAVSVEDIMNPPMGSYRIVLYVYGETKEDNDIYLKYEIPFEVKALTAYPKEA